MDRTDRSPGSCLPLRLTLICLLLGPGCASMGLDRGKPLIPTGFQTRTGPFLICTNARLDPEAPVVRQLSALEGEVSATLGLRIDPAEKPIEIYLLDDRPTFDHFLQSYYPNLPRRRAFFLANGPQRVVYTFLGDRTVEDVRHEATHALLHAAVGDMPLWLDEGLAEYFEGASPDAAGTDVIAGVNAEHLERLPLDLAAGWRPDLARLESLRQVREMTPRDYRESWAWVHFLLNGDRSQKTALLAYLGDLRTAPDPPTISRRLGGAVDPQPVLAHLGRVRSRTIATASDPAPRDPTVRLQSGPIDSEPGGATAATRAVAVEAAPVANPAPGVGGKRRSLIGRVFGWLGS